MTAQPQPQSIQIGGGINEKVDDAAGQQPEIIENCRYARFGALSKRNGYRIDTKAPLPTTPYAAPNHEFVALDGDKFVARKTQYGMQFYQRRGATGTAFGHAEQRALGDPTVAGTAGRLRPQLSPMPAIQGPTANEGLLCDVACPPTFLVGFGAIYAYVRLEPVDYDILNAIDIFDIVIEYIDAVDTRLTVREPTRLKRAIRYSADVHRQIRAIDRGNDQINGPGLNIVYTHNDTSGGVGIYARWFTPGTDASSDQWGSQQKLIGTTGTATVAANLVRNSGGFDCDVFLGGDTVGAFSVLYPLQYGVAWLKVKGLSPSATVEQYAIWSPQGYSSAITVKSIAMTGDDDGNGNQEIAFGVVSEWSLAQNAIIRFNATWIGAPTGINVHLMMQNTEDASSAMTGVVVANSAVAGRFIQENGQRTYLAGINTGDRGLIYRLCDKGQADFYPATHGIACAWATGRPHTVYNAAGQFVRIVMPMVSFGGELGGGAGLFADVTPLSTYKTTVRNGAPLLATYAIDEVALSTRSVDSAGPASTPVIRTADWNAGFRMKPCHGSTIPFGPAWAVPRWINAFGVPPIANLIVLEENNTDFEFLEPGVMMVGPGVPVMLDTIQGLSELGFHASPAVLYLVSRNASPAGSGYAAGTILQYRFQYRFVDGNGLAQVSPLTEPFQVSIGAADQSVFFELAPLDLTLRHLGAVVIDVYRTEAGLATFYWTASVTAEGGKSIAGYVDIGPATTVLDKTRTPNIENYFMTPPCATHAFRGAFRDVLVTRENELWPSKRRLSTTAPQFDIVDAAAWDAPDPVLTGGEIDGKLVLFSKKRVAYTYEVNGTLAPFVDIPSDIGATEGSRAFSTHLGVFYQCPAGIRLVGRDLALHEVGLPVIDTLGTNTIRGGIKVPAQGEIRLRLDDGRTFIVFDYFQGGPDQPVWYVTRFNEQGGYTDENGGVHTAGLRAIADQAFTPDGRLLYLCRLGFLLEETVGRFRDEDQWVTMRVRSSTNRGNTAITYLASIEGAVNLELPPGSEPGPVTLRLYGDYMQSVSAQPTVTQQWASADIEAFDRRQIQITAGEKVMNAPAVAIEYSDERAGDVNTTSDGFGYRLSAMVIVMGPREQKSLFPVANGARK